MPSRNFHAQNFDESTKAKLEIFQLYARAWLPVFLAPLQPKWKEVHVYDFFCGPGSDPNGIEGSPVRLVRELLQCRGSWVTNGITVHLHFYDASASKTLALQEKLIPMLAHAKNVVLDVQTLPFEQAFPKAAPTLRSKEAAKLVLLDPCGVNFVTQDVFSKLNAAPVADFLLFLASSYLHRFREVDSIKLKIKRPDDFNHLHRVLAGKCPDERAVIEVCFDHGMRRQHAVPVLQALKDERLLDYDFRVPKIERNEALTLPQAAQLRAPASLPLFRVLEPSKAAIVFAEDDSVVELTHMVSST